MPTGCWAWLAGPVKRAISNRANAAGRMVLLRLRRSVFLFMYRSFSVLVLFITGPDHLILCLSGAIFQPSSRRSGDAPASNCDGQLTVTVIVLPAGMEK